MFYDQDYMNVEDVHSYLSMSKLDFAEQPLGLLLSVESTECGNERARSCPSTQKCMVTLLPVESVSYDIPVGYMGVKREERCYCEDGSEGGSSFLLSTLPNLILSLKIPVIPYKSINKIVPTRSLLYPKITIVSTLPSVIISLKFF